MAKEIDILVIESGKAPRPARVEDTLEAFQQIVGGPIEAGCYLPQRVMLICNGELNKGPRWNPAKRFQWGEEKGRERVEFSPLAETKWSGLSSDEGLPSNRPNPGNNAYGAPAEAQRSGFGGERRGKGTERSGFRPDAIAGTFLLCSFEGEHFASLSPAQQVEFQAYFALPGLGGGGR